MQYIVIILLIFLFGILFYKYPKLILPLLIFAVPLQRYNFYLESLGLSLKAILIILPAAYFALFLSKRLTVPNNKYLLSFSILLLFGVFSSVLSSINPIRTISVFAFSSLTIAYAYIFVLLIQDRKAFFKAVQYVVVAGTVVSSLSIWQFFQFGRGRSVMLPLESYFPAKTITAESFEFSVGSRSYLRPASTFVDVNLTAGFLTIVVLVVFANLLNELQDKEIDWRGLAMSTTLFSINVVAFLMTVSRSGYLGLLVGGLILLILNWRSFLNMRVMAFMIGVLFFVVGCVFLFDTPIEAMWGRFQDTFLRHDTTGSTQEHFLFSESAFKIFKDNWLFGIGAGNFEEFYLTRVDPLEDTAYTYNVYLGFLAETGVIGFVGQLGFIIFVIYSSIRSLISIKDSKSIQLRLSALVGAFVAILVANLFYAYYILFFVWMLIGLLLTFSLNKLYEK